MTLWSPKASLRVVDIGIVDVVARVHGGVVGEPVVEAEHAGVFANGVGGHLGDLVGDAVDRSLPDRIGVDDRFQGGRRCEHLGAKRGVGHEIDERLAEALAQALIVGKEEALSFTMGPPRLAPNWFRGERGNRARGRTASGNPRRRCARRKTCCRDIRWCRSSIPR